MKLLLTAFAIAALVPLGLADDQVSTPFGQQVAPLTPEPDRSALMIAGIDRYLDRATAESVASRTQFWKRDFSSSSNYEASVRPNREKLARLLGVVDTRVNPVLMEHVSGPDRPALIAENPQMSVFAVRWSVLDGVTAEGLLVEPKGKVRARIVLLPDAHVTPVSSLDQAQRLAEAGCEVLIPTLVNRQCTWSGNPKFVMTDQTHREWVWRPAYELGRHIIGFEVQKVLAAVDWFGSREGLTPVGVAGSGEGGLVALAAAALDLRIDVALVSGYFQPREAMWSEPIYRSVWGLLREFGDAEIASLVAPRGLVIDTEQGPLVEGPPPLEQGRRKCAATGRIQRIDAAALRREVDRARALCTGPDGIALGVIDLVSPDESMSAFLRMLTGTKLPPPAKGVAGRGVDGRDENAIQKRQVTELIEYCQRLMRNSEATRADYWKEAVPKSAEVWHQSTQHLRTKCWDDLIGRLPDPSLPPNLRARKLEDRAEYAMWEVTLDVWPEVFAWGYLLVPKDIKLGERRPVVVCQHGLEGLPAAVVEEDEKSNDWRYYRAFARQLASRGFICFCPHNPYRGEFRQLERKAHPLGLTLFSFILGQHQRILEWLGSLPFVDAKRIGFYGLSYGGVSAVRLPSLLDGYSMSICSAAFNDWPRKIGSLDFASSYVFTREYEIFSFDLSNTFSNAELAALIAPRPFMVERGHNDAVAPDEWVAHEYAKVRRLYTKLGIPERTEIEFFNGGHVIHGKRTFDFLHRHLNWPAPAGE
jgi:dienelactone hydrolase